MPENDSFLDRMEEYLETDEAIPAISCLLITLLLFFSNTRYFLIETGASLLFYAVLVRMWTAMTPSDSELLHGDFYHAFFLLISAGAVAMGIMIENGIEAVSGSVLPAQFLALAVLTSRIYLKSQRSDTLLEAILWKNVYDRYVVLITCLFVILLPIAVHQFKISTLVILESGVLVSRTTESFIYLSVLGLGIGAISYVYLEDQLGFENDTS